MDLVIWGGPVEARSIANVDWHRPTTVLTLNEGIGGIGSSAFAALGASLGPNPIQALLAQHGIPTPDRLALAGFSAFHGLAEAILSSADAGMVNAFAAFDAYFTGPSKAVKPGYLAFAKRAAAGETLMIVTTSANGGNGYPPGNESFAVLAAQLDLSPEAPPANVPPPVSCVGAEDFVWADYELTVPHAGHVHQLADPWLSSVLAPYMAGEKPDLALASGPGYGTLRRVAKAAGGALLVAGVAYIAFELAKGRRIGNPQRLKRAA